MTVQELTKASQERAAVRSPFALVALASAALLAVLDGTVVAVALQPLSRAFGAPLTTMVWVTVGYLLAAASMLPLLGWATARFGRRRVFLTGLVLFILGSALSAAAWSAPALIGFRMIQGFGGGLLEPMSLALAAAISPKESIGRVLGLMSTIINVAPVLGPIVGTLLLQAGSWRWLFIVNLPAGLIVLVLALTLVRVDEPDRETPAPRADVRGLALLTSGYVLVLFALNRSGWIALAVALIGVVLLAFYVRHALTARVTPALDLRLLRRPGYGASIAIMGLVGLIMYGQLTSLPLVAAARGATGLQRGLFVTALGIGLLVSMSNGGRISDRTGPKRLVGIGGAVTAVLLGLFVLVGPSLGTVALFALFIAVGLGFGATASPTVASVYRTLPLADQAQGTTSMFMTVQLAASLGVTLLGLLPTDRFFTLLAVAAIGIVALSRRLPGETDQQR
ncbi:MAG TPA: MFS transporter [Micromonosporaceae bacterium]